MFIAKSVEIGNSYFAMAKDPAEATHKFEAERIVFGDFMQGR